MEQVGINPSYSRLPIILLVDNSASMREDGKIDILNNALTDFKKFIEEDEHLCKRVDICVVAFGNRVTLEHDFSSIHDFNLPILQANGPSLMGSGILKALALLMARKSFYKKKAIEYLQPQFYLFGGSTPDDFAYIGLAGDKRWNEISEAMKEYEFIPFAITPVGEPHFSLEVPLRILKKELDVNELLFAEYISDDKVQSRDSSEHSSPLPTEGWAYIDPDEVSTSDCADKPKAAKQPTRYKILGASMIGPLHIIKGIPCQDAYAYETLPSGHIIIAIADGLGSAAMSEIGSRIAVDAAVEAIKKKTIDSIKNDSLSSLARDSVVAARKALEEKALTLQCTLCDLACTFISVIMLEDSLVVAHIGDGAVVAKKGEDLFVVSEPGDSEYVNEVTPLTSRKWEDSLNITPVYSGISGVMAFSDGLQRAALRKSEDRRIPYNAFCDPLFLFAEEITDLQNGEKELKEFLASKKMSDHSEDDKTLIFVTLTNNKQEINQ